MLEAPMAVALLNATTLSSWLTAAPFTSVTDCTLLTVTPLNAAGAVAVQISETPRDVAARATRVHARPAPEMVSVCVLVPVVGPSEAANATSTSAAVVLNAGVVRVPVPFEKTFASTVGPLSGAPLETTSATALPVATFAPAAGVWLITWPAGTLALAAVVTAPTERPADVIALCAAACVRPTTFGTATVAGAGPSETTIATELLGATLVFAAGDSLITNPAATLALFAVVIAPTLR